MCKPVFRLAAVLLALVLGDATKLLGQEGGVVVCSVLREQPTGTATRYGITRSDFYWIKQAVPGSVALRALVDEVRVGERTRRAVVVGCTGKLNHPGSIHLIRGRFLTEKDQQTAENVCVISQTLARRLFGAANGIGKNVKLGESYYLVVGVCRDPPGRVCGTHLQSIYKQPLQYSSTLFVPLKSMQTRMGDTQVMQSDGTFNIQHYQLSELWVPGDKRIVEAILRRNRDPKDELADLLITRRLLGFKAGDQ